MQESFPLNRYKNLQSGDKMKVTVNIQLERVQPCIWQTPPLKHLQLVTPRMNPTSYGPIIVQYHPKNFFGDSIKLIYTFTYLRQIRSDDVNKNRGETRFQGDVQTMFS